jgi:AraC-like DNA-binding protein
MRTASQRRAGVLVKQTGYTRKSHFIKEFRSRFDATPGGYADAHIVGAPPC